MATRGSQPSGAGGDLSCSSLCETVQPIISTISRIDLLGPQANVDVLSRMLYEQLQKFGDQWLPEAPLEIQQHLTSAKNTELTIAITGETGSGKSSFINRLRGLGPEDAGAAPVGVTETTMKPKCYLHPQLPNVKFWDLPGIGSPNFQAKDYLQKVKFSQYDFFIIISCDRFRENDKLLAKEIQKEKKLFYFVRSKVDQDLENERRDRPKTYNEEKVLERIRKNCKENLRSFSSGIFLVSSWYLDKYDFPVLVETLGNDLPTLKKRAFLLSLPNMCPEIVSKKRDILEAELWKVALVSAGINAVPLPGLPVMVDTGFLKCYMEHVYKILGLDSHSLAQVASFVNQPVETLKGEVKSCPEENIQLNNIPKGIGSVVHTLLKWFKHFGKFTGPLNAVMSFVATYWMLLQFLKDVVEDAERVRAKALESI